MGVPEPRTPVPSKSAEKPPRPAGLLWSPWTLVLALMTFGPLALPLVWRNPHLSTRTKTVLTIGLLGLTIALTYALGSAVSGYLKLMEGLME